MPESPFNHETDLYPGWHQPCESMREPLWRGKPQLHLRAGVVQGVAQLDCYALLPNGGQLPSVAQIIKTRWRGDTTTPWDLATAAHKGLGLWLEGYSQ